MTTDALVSELRRIIEGAPDADMAWTLAEVRIREEVERLTRERDSAQQSNENWMRECLEARAERDEARRELAECRKAFRRARVWGIASKGWHAFVAADLAEWVDGGMNLPIPSVDNHPFAKREESARETALKTEA